MTLSQTSRFSLSQWSADSDPAVTRADLNDDNSQVESLAMVAARGTFAARPAPGVRERLYLASDQDRLYWDDGAAWHAVTPPIVQPVPVAFHISGALTAGLKIPKFIAPRNMTLLTSRAVLDSGSGATYAIYINAAAHANIPASAAVGTTVVLNDFTDTDINAGDRVQVFISNIGTTAADLSITIDAVWR